jgi:hypothetical protein
MVMPMTPDCAPSFAAADGYSRPARDKVADADRSDAICSHSNINRIGFTPARRPLAFLVDAAQVSRVAAGPTTSK